jgi:hypothetical protein
MNEGDQNFSVHTKPLQVTGYQLPVSGCRAKNFERPVTDRLFALHGLATGNWKTGN